MKIIFKKHVDEISLDKINESFIVLAHCTYQGEILILRLTRQDSSGYCQWVPLNKCVSRTKNWTFGAPPVCHLFREAIVMMLENQYHCGKVHDVQVFEEFEDALVWINDIYKNKQNI